MPAAPVQAPEPEAAAPRQAPAGPNAATTWDHDRARLAARWSHSRRPRIAVLGGASFLASEGDWNVDERFVHLAEVHRGSRADSSYRGMSFVEQRAGENRSPLPLLGPALHVWERTLADAGAVAVDADYVRRVLASDRTAWTEGRDLSLRALMQNTDYLLLVDAREAAGSELGYELSVRLLASKDGRVLGASSSGLHREQLAATRRVAVAGAAGYEYVEDRTPAKDVEIVRMLTADLLNSLAAAGDASH